MMQAVSIVGCAEESGEAEFEAPDAHADDILDDKAPLYSGTSIATAASEEPFESINWSPRRPAGLDRLPCKEIMTKFKENHEYAEKESTTQEDIPGFTSVPWSENLHRRRRDGKLKSEQWERFQEILQQGTQVAREVDKVLEAASKMSALGSSKPRTSPRIYGDSGKKRFAWAATADPLLRSSRAENQEPESGDCVGHSSESVTADAQQSMSSATLKKPYGRAGGKKSLPRFSRPCLERNNSNKRSNRRRGLEETIAGGPFSESLSENSATSDKEEGNTNVNRATDDVSHKRKLAWDKYANKSEWRKSPLPEQPELSPPQWNLQPSATIPSKIRTRRLRNLEGLLAVTRLSTDKPSNPDSLWPRKTTIPIDKTPQGIMTREEIVDIVRRETANVLADHPGTRTRLIEEKRGTSVTDMIGLILRAHRLASRQHEEAPTCKKRDEDPLASEEVDISCFLKDDPFVNAVTYLSKITLRETTADKRQFERKVDHPSPTLDSVEGTSAAEGREDAKSPQVAAKDSRDQILPEGVSEFICPFGLPHPGLYEKREVIHDRVVHVIKKSKPTEDRRTWLLRNINKYIRLKSDEDAQADSMFRDQLKSRSSTERKRYETSRCIAPSSSEMNREVNRRLKCSEMEGDIVRFHDVPIEDTLQRRFVHQLKRAKRERAKLFSSERDVKEKRPRKRVIQLPASAGHDDKNSRVEQLDETAVQRDSKYGPSRKADKATYDKGKDKDEEDEVDEKEEPKLMEKEEDHGSRVSSGFGVISHFELTQSQLEKKDAAKAIETGRLVEKTSIAFSSEGHPRLQTEKPKLASNISKTLNVFQVLVKQILAKKGKRFQGNESTIDSLGYPSCTKHGWSRTIELVFKELAKNLKRTKVGQFQEHRRQQKATLLSGKLAVDNEEQGLKNILGGKDPDSGLKDSGAKRALEIQTQTSECMAILAKTKMSAVTQAMEEQTCQTLKTEKRRVRKANGARKALASYTLSRKRQVGFPVHFRGKKDPMSGRKSNKFANKVKSIELELDEAEAIRIYGREASLSLTKERKISTKTQTSYRKVVKGSPSKTPCSGKERGTKGANTKRSHREATQPYIPEESVDCVQIRATSGQLTMEEIGSLLFYRSVKTIVQSVQEEKSKGPVELEFYREEPRSGTATKHIQDSSGTTVKEGEDLTPGSSDVSRRIGTTDLLHRMMLVIGSVASLKSGRKQKGGPSSAITTFLQKVRSRSLQRKHEKVSKLKSDISLTSAGSFVKKLRRAGKWKGKGKSMCVSSDNITSLVTKTTSAVEMQKKRTRPPKSSVEKLTKIIRARRIWLIQRGLYRAKLPKYLQKIEFPYYYRTGEQVPTETQEHIKMVESLGNRQIHYSSDSSSSSDDSMKAHMCFLTSGVKAGKGPDHNSEGIEDGVMSDDSISCASFDSTYLSEDPSLSSLSPLDRHRRSTRSFPVNKKALPGPLQQVRARRMTIIRRQRNRNAKTATDAAERSGRLKYTPKEAHPVRSGKQSQEATPRTSLPAAEYPSWSPAHGNQKQLPPMRQAQNVLAINAKSPTCSHRHPDEDACALGCPDLPSDSQGAREILRTSSRNQAVYPSRYHINNQQRQETDFNGNQCSSFRSSVFGSLGSTGNSRRKEYVPSTCETVLRRSFGNQLPQSDYIRLSSIPSSAGTRPRNSCKGKSEETQEEDGEFEDSRRMISGPFVWNGELPSDCPGSRVVTAKKYLRSSNRGSRFPIGRQRVCLNQNLNRKNDIERNAAKHIFPSVTPVTVVDIKRTSTPAKDASKRRMIRYFLTLEPRNMKTPPRATNVKKR